MTDFRGHFAYSARCILRINPCIHKSLPNSHELWAVKLQDILGHSSFRRQGNYVTVFMSKMSCPFINPWIDEWTAHFRHEDGNIVPLTPEGRVTEYILQFNRPEFVGIRKRLMDAGIYS